MISIQDLTEHDYHQQFRDTYCFGRISTLPEDIQTGTIKFGNVENTSNGKIDHVWVVFKPVKEKQLTALINVANIEILKIFPDLSKGKFFNTSSTLPLCISRKNNIQFKKGLYLSRTLHISYPNIFSTFQNRVYEAIQTINKPRSIARKQCENALYFFNSGHIDVFNTINIIENLYTPVYYTIEELIKRKRFGWLSFALSPSILAINMPQMKKIAIFTEDFYIGDINLDSGKVELLSTVANWATELVEEAKLEY